MNAEIKINEDREISGTLKQWSSMPTAQLAWPAMFLHSVGTQCQRRNGVQSLAEAGTRGVQACGVILLREQCISWFLIRIFDLFGY